MPFFWTSVFETVSQPRSLSFQEPTRCVEVIALNFGEWDSQRAGDPYALDCHCHAHLYLSEDAHLQLNQKEGWGALRGRHYAPPHYMKVRVTPCPDRRGDFLHHTFDVAYPCVGSLQCPVRSDPPSKWNVEYCWENFWLKKK